MRKIMLVLVVLLLAAPAMAVVTVTATDDGTNDGWVTISYIQTDASAGKRPRAFALDLGVDIGEICEVDTTGCQPFPVYMGTIVIDQNGTVVNPGTPVAPAAAPGSAGPLGSGAVTIEMGSLYDPAAPVPGVTQPLLAGDLIRVKMNKTCALTVIANAPRATGGVVLEDGTTPGANPSGCAVGPVLYGGPDYAEWHSASIAKHASWGNDNQCHGDIDGASEKFGFDNIDVGFNDIPLFVAAFTERDTDPNFDPAADLDHAGEKFGFDTVRCGFNDIPIFVGYFTVKVGDMPNDCQSCQPVSP